MKSLVDRKAEGWASSTGLLLLLATFLLASPIAAERPVDHPVSRGRPVHVPTRGTQGEIGPVEGGGKWRVQPGNPERRRANARRLPEAPLEQKKWRARLTRHADKTVSGDFSIDAGTQKLIRQGRVEGRAEKGRFWGKVLDDEGRQAATFSVGMGADGQVEGTYVTSDGETGTFSWEE